MEEPQKDEGPAAGPCAGGFWPHPHRRGDVRGKCIQIFCGRRATSRTRSETQCLANGCSFLAAGVVSCKRPRRSFDSKIGREGPEPFEDVAGAVYCPTLVWSLDEGGRSQPEPRGGRLVASCKIAGMNARRGVAVWASSPGGPPSDAVRNHWRKGRGQTPGIRPGPGAISAIFRLQHHRQLRARPVPTWGGVCPQDFWQGVDESASPSGLMARKPFGAIAGRG
ncbi:unnamed protein product [Amoebophrya sp. A120]|nr:unnamed protein product [Amoebophrya sp. A120]|eukprot:GSA120T00012192001.1